MKKTCDSNEESSTIQTPNPSVTTACYLSSIFFQVCLYFYIFMSDIFPALFHCTRQNKFLFRAHNFHFSPSSALHAMNKSDIWVRRIILCSAQTPRSQTSYYKYPSNHHHIIIGKWKSTISMKLIRKNIFLVATGAYF